jgi:hypothetical protein
VWTTKPEVKLVKERQSNAFTLSADGAPIVLKAFFFGAPDMKISTYRGSNNPFAGWVTGAKGPQPTDAIMIEQAAEARSFTVWILRESGARPDESETPPQLSGWSNEQNWGIRVSLGSRKQEISRRGGVISVRDAKSTASTNLKATLLPCSPAVSAQVKELHASYQRAASDHPRFPDLTHTRFRASVLILVLSVLQGFWFLADRIVFGKYLIAVRGSALVCWFAVDVWLQFFKLRIPSSL